MSEHRLFQFYRGKKANMPTLSEAEPAYATDEKRLYVGDGSTNVGMAKQSEIPTKTSQLTNDSGYITGITVDSSLSSTSTNPVQNKAVNEAVGELMSMSVNLSQNISSLQTTVNGKANSNHNQASSTINAMTGYSKPSSTGAIATTDTLNGAIGKLEKALDAKVPTSRTVNGKALSANISLSASDVGAVPTSRTVNGKALSANITLSAADVGADASGAANTALTNAKSYTDTQLNNKPDTEDLGFVRIVSCSSSDGVTYTGTTDGVTTLKTGMTIVFVSSKTSASKAPTLNINNLGAKSIKRRLSHLSTSTQEGYATTWLYANKPYFLVYDGTQWIVDGLTKPSAADLYGTPAEATKATQDGNGKVIADTYATKASIPTALKNPNALTFTGGATGTYDGSAAKTISIPTAAAIADEVVVCLKDRGDTIVGAVNSNNDITLVSGLADGIYALKYENSDGTKTAIGYLNMDDGIGTVTAYKNMVDASAAELNVRWSNSSYGWVSSNGTGYFVTDYIPVTLSTDTANPTIMHFRGGSLTGEANLIFYNSSKSVINSATASVDGAGVRGNTASVTTDENGDYQLSLGYKNGAFDSAWRSGVAYMRVGLFVANKTLTADDIKNVIITVDELIKD